MSKLKYRRPKPKKTPYQELADYVVNHKLPWWSYVEIPSCCVCGKPFFTMIRTGSLYFCPTHFDEVFDRNALERDQEKYKYWLELTFNNETNGRRRQCQKK